MRRSIVAITTGTLVGALGLGGGLAYASTTGGNSGGSTGTAAAAKPAVTHPARRAAAARRFAFLGRAVHVEAVLRGKNHTFHTWELDRGLFTSISTSTSPATITITRVDNVKVTATITTATRFRGIPESKLASGDRVLVVQRDGIARTVASRPPAPAKTGVATG